MAKERARDRGKYGLRRDQDENPENVLKIANKKQKKKIQTTHSRSKQKKRKRKKEKKEKQRKK